MTLHLPTLLIVATAALALAAAGMTLFGARQRVYRGYWWWTVAQWALLGALVLQLTGSGEPLPMLVSELLMLQWPVVVLGGVRRFHARNGTRVPATLDWALFAVAGVAWLVAWGLRSAPPVQVAAFSIASAALHLYVATIATRVADFGRSGALKALLATEASTACVYALRAAQALAGGAEALPEGDVLIAGGLVVVAAALVMVVLALVFTYGRTEHNLSVLHRKLRYLADIDLLTRIPNRRHFHELAANALGSRRQEDAVVMMFDVDHFKRVNDLLGHATGDEALRQVSTCLRESLRAHDIAGRLGGDEFAVLLPDTSVHDAMGVAQRIMSKLDDRQVAPRTAPLSLSFGVVQMQAGETIAQALRRADQGLLEAKRQGRRRAVWAEGVEAEPVFRESRSLNLPAT
jgi:diguanylate cyclase